MEIRKADSKGRLTGFEPDTHYRIKRKGLMVHAELVTEEEAIPAPLGPKATEYLADFGLDVNRIMRDNANLRGYDELQFDAYGNRHYEFGAYVTKRKPWPEGFSWSKFMELAISEG